jgi:penicillin-binding protein 2
MYRDNERHKNFSRRTLILGGGQLAVFAVLAGRMYQLQVLESDRYKLQADDNRINVRLIPPPRGRVFDRFGTLLGGNRENFQVLVVAENTPDVEQTLAVLGQLIPISEDDLIRVRRELGKGRPFVPVTVREHLDWREVARLQVNAPDLPGISIDVGQSREYVYGEQAAHVLGYVAIVAEEELTGEPLLSLPGFRIGKNGVEKAYEEKLRGKAGTTQLEVNAVGRIRRELSREEGVPGKDVHLTIDMRLQAFMHDRLAGETSASAVVMDVDRGDILAMASKPSFDPNQFAKGEFSDEMWKALVRDPLAPMTNKAISGNYAPGSTFKIAVALAGLESGLIDPNEKVFCRGFTELGRAKFHCWKKHGHGWVDLVESLQKSCDIYFYDLAKQIGIDKIAEMANKLGLGHALGIEIPGERDGLIPTRGWKLAMTGVKWQRGETLIAGIGQGFILATPLQLAVMTARVANGGYAVKPRLIQSGNQPSARHRIPGSDRTRGHGDGGQDRHFAGSPDLEARARYPRPQE